MPDRDSDWLLSGVAWLEASSGPRGDQRWRRGQEDEGQDLPEKGTQREFVLSWQIGT